MFDECLQLHGNWHWLLIMDVKLSCTVARNRVQCGDLLHDSPVLLHDNSWNWYSAGHTNLVKYRVRYAQGVKFLDSTCLDLAFSKPNVICRTDKQKFFWSYMTDMWNRDTILTPLSLIVLFLCKFSLMAIEVMMINCTGPLVHRHQYCQTLSKKIVYSCLPFTDSSIPM